MILRTFSLVLTACALGAGIAAAQAPGPVPPRPVAQGSPEQTNPVCVRLESQLASLDRGSADTRPEQLRKTEEAAGKLQGDLDRLTAQAQRAGCQGGGFFLFGSAASPQCDQINSQIQSTRSGLSRLQSELQRMQGGGSLDRSEQRRSIIGALAQSDCGPQYRSAAPARPPSFFEAIFGRPATSSPDGNFETPQSSTFRTVCVRTCDGYYYPISFSTVASKFRDDERTCQRTCPAAETMLFTHRNPGEDMNQAVSNSGRRYTELPGAFKYRQEYTPACSCRKPGESWADALGARDETFERGDILVTEERAKQMSQPQQPAAPIRGARRPQDPPSAQPAAGETTDSISPAIPSEKRAIRSVGPTFYPVR